MTPQRIQLKRTKGWRKPEGAVVVSRPSKWGNPWRVSPFEGGWSVDDAQHHWDVYETERAARARAVELFDLHLGAFGLYEIASEDFEVLRGKDLACWCPLDQPCHADVLLRVANGDH